MNHMTSHESLLIDVDKTVKCKVIEMKGGTRYIKEVMNVLGLDENLLSVGHMVGHGY